MALGLQKLIGKILLYLALAFGFLGVCGLLVVIVVRERIADIGPWLFLATFTSVLVYVSIRRFTDYWNKLSFWATLAALTGAHLAGFIFLLRHYPGWRPLWDVPIIMIEAAAFVVILGAIFGSPKHSRHRRA